jgi:hypothetical protein
MFEGHSTKDALVIAILKRVFLLALGCYLVIGLISAYRAWYQVKSLELKASDAILRSGSVVETNLVSYARTPIDVRVELIQGSHSETVAVQRLPGNDWGFFDPRTRSAEQKVMVTQDVLNRFQLGKAQLRATAIGRHQWMRLPPPVLRELVVELRP